MRSAMPFGHADPGWSTPLQGFDGVLTDYVHPRKFPVIGPIAKWALRLLTTGVLVGVYQFETNDIGASRLTATCAARARCGRDTECPRALAGLTELIKKAWHVERHVEKSA